MEKRKEIFNIGEKVIVMSFHFDPSKVTYKQGTIIELPKKDIIIPFYKVKTSDELSRTVISFQLIRLSPVAAQLYNIEE